MNYSSMGHQAICQTGYKSATEPLIVFGDAGIGAPAPITTVSPLWSVFSVASSAAGAYHGYKRNDSVGWAVWWGLMGGLFPVITPVIAIAQGFGKRE